MKEAIEALLPLEVRKRLAPSPHSGESEHYRRAIYAGRRKRSARAERRVIARLREGFLRSGYNMPLEGAKEGLVAKLGSL